MTTNHFENDLKTLPISEPVAGSLRRNGAVFKSLLPQTWATLWLMFFLAFCVNAAAQETADTLPQPLEQLRIGSMAEREQAIEQLGEDGRNLKLLQALQDGQLMDWKADSRLVIASESAKGYNLRDPFDGKAVLADVERDAVGKLNLTNKLRSVLRKAVGGLQLNADSADMRLEAVKAIAKDADDKALQMLRKRLEKERDAAVLAAIQEALWLQDINSDDKPARLAAIEALKNINNQSAYNRLRELAEPDAVADPEVAAQAKAAVKKIESRLQNYAAIETVFFGLSLGAVLVLASIGLAITFGVMGVINMAHGELMMLGAYTTYVMQQLLPNYLGTALILSIPMAFLVAALVGVAIERGIIRFLYGRPLETLLATFGVSLFLQQSVRSIFSPLNRSVSTPDWMSGSWQINDFLSLTWNRFYILVFCLLVFTALLQILKRTKLGLEVRAVAQNRGMAKAMGIPTARVDAMTFGLGSGIAGVAGVALSQITNVGPNLGQAYIVDSFMVVVFGGVGNLFGTLVAGFSLGIANKFLEPYAGAVLAKILVLVFIILFIQKKPRGLFPQKGRAADG
ncbi:urea ABC transporter permease subunit UrtB [Methylomonas rivi]|uniref:Urea ABC transporter permease subunit UrtB n=1 Tax=Methylomonas rivi TaxID=2952226 RepID=A0ABT1U5M3_9GAMM|nr:urea ABC transporter permease subunit UrtB [Methylomonas sp. WSC-6]MCQ8129157.1 urea ABC transporter permease subunit UrtB [Methylomonas sp. WSC-6]